MQLAHYENIGFRIIARNELDVVDARFTSASKLLEKAAAQVQELLPGNVPILSGVAEDFDEVFFGEAEVPASRATAAVSRPSFRDNAPDPGGRLASPLPGTSLIVIIIELWSPIPIIDGTSRVFQEEADTTRFPIELRVSAFDSGKQTSNLLLRESYEPQWLSDPDTVLQWRGGYSRLRTLLERTVAQYLRTALESIVD